jgi:alpha 1,2-mannosyltransferase
VYIRRRVRALTDVKIEFGLIPADHWYQPSSIDEQRASAIREDMVKNNVIYGGMVSLQVFTVLHAHGVML